MSNELLPCPFCGGKAIAEDRSDLHPAWLIGCDRCDCVMDVYYRTNEEAAAAWNRRADSQRIQELEVELLNVLDVAIARGAELGYEDEDYHARYQQLTGKEWDDHEQRAEYDR